MNSLPALTGNKDESLQAALSRMLAEFESGARAGVLTAEDDPHVTAESCERGQVEMVPVQV